MKTETARFETGIDEQSRIKVAGEMKKVLADTYALYLKTHIFHWNVTGPQFTTLHTLFEEHYNALWTSVDEVAERIRALGVKAPVSYREFAELSSVEDESGDLAAGEMLSKLLDGHQTVIRTVRQVLPVASEAGDDVSVDLLTQRLTYHEKTAWMLRSMLEQ